MVLNYNRFLSANGAAVISVVLVMHITQAIILLIDEDSSGGIAISSLMIMNNWIGIYGNYNLAIVLLTCASCSLIALLHPSFDPVYRLVLMLPQQSLLTIAALGAVSAIYKHSYADGVLRSAGFILADQLPLFVILATHTIAIVRRAKDRV